MDLLELLEVEPGTDEADRWTGLPHDLRQELTATLQKLRQHGELRLVRSHWCYREGSDWVCAGSCEAGLLFADWGVVVISGGARMTLWPQKGGE